MPVWIFDQGKELKVFATEDPAPKTKAKRALPSYGSAPINLIQLSSRELIRP
jgi:hypothetical protein